MRLWTLHPSYLDRQGLLALWREGLLAQAVLLGRTRGYRRHPQLERFKRARVPVAAIGHYLRIVYKEARSRGYSFDRSRIAMPGGRARIRTTKGQMAYEKKHLSTKLEVRDPERFRKTKDARRLRPNPVFSIVSGGIEEWERAKR
jgi:hypothetical protein